MSRVDDVHSLNAKLLEESYRISSGTHHYVGQLLEAGADANARSTTPGQYGSALGNLVAHGQSRAVKEMLEYGACVHWPERDIDVFDLTGDENGSYEQTLDALGISLASIAWNLNDLALLDEDDSDLIALVEEKIEILRMLVSAGANPTWEDPGNICTPMESFALIFEGSSFSKGAAPLKSFRVFSLFCEVADLVLRATPDAPVIHQGIINNDWGDLPYGWSRLGQTAPVLRPVLAAHLQEQQLLGSTPEVNLNRSSALRL